MCVKLNLTRVLVGTQQAVVVGCPLFVVTRLGSFLHLLLLLNCLDLEVYGKH